MCKGSFKIAIVLTLSLLISILNVYGQENQKEDQIMVTLRMIGHELLNLSEDSTSRVLAIQRESVGYRISFENEFKFEPDNLSYVVDSLFRMTRLAGHYLVAVEKCDSQEIVYSYEMGNAVYSDVIPCRGRDLPKDCYSILIKIYSSLDGIPYAEPFEDESPEETKVNDEASDNSFPFYEIILGLVVLISLVVIYKMRNRPKSNTSLIPIGKYNFDRINMTLSFTDDVIELTGKEADLLFLLYSSANTPIEREVILNEVWGDEGDYIGRTLDVFISRLRKKLEKDTNLKIINIRGVGYKMVINRKD